MPSLFRKELIGPGEYFVNFTDGDGEQHVGVFRVTPDRVRHWFESAKAMLSRGIQIPIPLEHGEERPMTTREAEAYRTRNNAGWMRGVEIGADGKLYGNMEITDAQVSAKILDGSIDKTSPFFEPSVLTGDGTEWDDVISHVCLTNKPVIMHQAGFERMAVAASRRPGGVPALEAVRGYVMKSARLSRDAEGGIMPSDMEEDLTGGSTGQTEKPKPEGETAVPETDSGVDGGGTETLELGAGSSVVSPELVDALASIGLYIPDNCTRNDLESMLLVAVQTALMQGESNAPETTDLDQSYGGDIPPATDEDGNPADDETGRPKPEEEQMTVPLSRKPASKYPNGQIPGRPAPAGSARPGQKPAALDAVALSRKVSIVEMRLKDQAKQALIDRVDALLEGTRCTPTQHAKLIQEVQTARMSVNGSGIVLEHSGIGARVQMLEEMPAGAALSRQSAPNVVEEDSPKFFSGGGTVTPERAKEIANQQMTSAGRSSK